MTKQNKPNVVLIFADDLGIGDVSAFNPDSKIHTKHLDALAESGMKFTDSHATSAVCTPSRYGLLTGRYNWRSRLKDFVIPGDAEALIEKDRRTLPQMLKDNGYQTAAIGKWHLGLDWTLKDEKDYEKYGLNPDHFEEPSPQMGRDGYFDSYANTAPIIGLDIDYEAPIKFGPNEYGFDYFFGTPASLDQPPFVVIENNHVKEAPNVLYGKLNLDRVHATDQRASELGPAEPEVNVKLLPDTIQEKVLATLDGFIESDDPFFLYYPMHLVHGPLVPADRFKGKSEIGVYGDFVLQLDSYVGEIVEKLKETGEYDNTLFVFTSDNGVSGVAGIEHLEKHGHRSSLDFRGHKSDIWEGGHREPTIISYPALIEAGTTSNHMVSHSDLYRSVAELLNEEVSDDTAEDSISNVSLWKGEDQAVREDIVHSSATGGFSIRRDFWKLNFVKHGGGMEAMGRLAAGEIEPDDFKAAELFDLRDDISETTNVIDKHPEVVEKLTEILKKYVENGRSTKGEPQENAQTSSGEWKQLNWMND